MFDSSLFENTYYVLFLFFIMVISNILQETKSLNNILIYLDKIRNKKLALFLFSAIAGLLPVPGRVSITAGILDGFAPKKTSKARENFGIIDFLSSHHYYLWSPLEKTIIIPMAVLGVSYLDIITQIYPLLIITFVFIFAYIYSIPDEYIYFKKSSPVKHKLPLWPLSFGILIIFFNGAIIFGLLFLLYLGLYIKMNKYHRDINKKIKKIFSVNAKLLIFVFFIIVFGNIIKEYSYLFYQLDLSTVDIFYIGLLSFIVSILLGSSSKFSGIVSYLSLIFGFKYFIFFFAMDFAGYLISPMHKCVHIGRMYFNTPIKKYYTVLGTWAILIISYGILQLYI